MNKLVCLLLLTGSAAGDSVGGMSALFSPEPNGLGYADHAGKLSAWWNLGELRLSDSLSLPLRINFHSNQDKVANSILGWNWWMPAVESTVAKEAENHVVVRMTGGHKLHLWKSMENPRLFRSPDLKWEGVADDRGGFRVSNVSEKIAMDFWKGRLQSMLLPDGEKISWSYDISGRPATIDDSRGRHLLSVAYDQQGFPEALRYVDRDGVDRDITMHVAPPGEADLPLLVPALESINAPGNRVRSFQYEHSDAENLTLSTRNAGQDAAADTFRWNATSGLLGSGNGVSYARSAAGQGATVLSRTFPDGRTESFRFGANGGGSEFSSGDVVRKLEYFSAPGTNHGLIKSSSKTENGSTETTKFFYDANSTLLRSDIFRDGKAEASTFYGENRSILKKISYQPDGSLIELAYEEGKKLPKITRKTIEQ